MPPRDRILISLILLLVLMLTLSCTPNPQPEGLTPVPTLAPAATLTLIPSLEEPPPTSGEPVASPQPEGEAEAPAGDADNGATVFAQNCASCHGENAEGGAVGPTLVSDELTAQDDDFYRQVILNGREGTAMPAWEGRLSTQEIEDVIAFVRSKQ
jgi:mono/diheme cytochrome c family protein